MALNLASRFEHVVGLDPSQGMVNVGLQPESGRVEYAVGGAEDLRTFADGEVDLIVAGELSWRLGRSLLMCRPGGPLVRLP